MTQEIPDQVLIVGGDGEAVAMVGMAQYESDVAAVAFGMAAAAGDPAELDRIAKRWEMDPQYAGYVSAGALSMLVTAVLDPLLIVLEQALPQHPFRAKLAEMRDEFGGGR